jgi:hypothetical protein
VEKVVDIVMNYGKPQEFSLTSKGKRAQNNSKRAREEDKRYGRREMMEESTKSAKRVGRTRDRTWITGIRIRCANHYTIQPVC